MPSTTDGTIAIGRSTGRSTGTPATRTLGVVTLVGVGWLILFGLFLSPADENQGESVRILYLHAPSAWLAYLAFVVTAAGSATPAHPSSICSMRRN